MCVCVGERECVCVCVSEFDFVQVMADLMLRKGDYERALDSYQTILSKSPGFSLTHKHTHTHSHSLSYSLTHTHAQTTFQLWQN